MSLFLLDRRSLVRMRGEDARKLLNDTLTCRFSDLGAGTGRWFALLSPQGKILVEGLATFEEDAFWFDLDSDVVADFLRRMKMYRLRAKVEIEEIADHAVVWTPDGDVPPSGSVARYGDERSPGLGTRHIVPRADLPHGIEPVGDAYERARVHAGVAEYPDFEPNTTFPHDIGMDFLRGLDFKKGCYVGQEVVSRMEHRGTARRRAVIVTGVPDGAGRGAPILVGERTIGEIGHPANGTAVAVVRLDRVTDGVRPTLGGLPVTLELPRWAGYQFGAAGGTEDAEAGD